ncbi:hypothetical protein L226DRAFT_617399 [Lentinus tigrinus ALCF2SS1-7]|uniref:Uncharacterized protein n=1 Tax=Lentinus tigrinus ALCF2SS1-6 TaxID=1328759 RepID=A0A5C2RSF3_9APHY|nr:hypothetical protein L227DRAFT_658254 [Lentinus tigrinus ALCF2SS1-6]RPD68689.1 hypothetical protein L226DRAFT_617399 [Lentinus tigrinus ALCF2SS1-7]
MATPYSTPRYSGAPNPTPRSTGKMPRAPIHNPYDKFTQPEFDAWIDDITGALKRALGRDDAPPLPTPAARVERHSSEEEDGIEDSFAEVRARRLAKGKERAREEDYEDEGIYEQSGTSDDASEGEEYGSSSEEEDEEDEEQAPKQREAEVIDLLSDDEEDEEEQEVGSSDEEAVAGPAPVFDDEEAAEGSEAGSVEENHGHAPLDEDEEELEDSDAGSEGYDQQVRSSPAPGPPSAHEVTEILDSDEEEEREAHLPAQRAIPPRFARKPDIVAPARIINGDDEEDNEQGEEEAEPFPPRTVEVDVDIQDPWSGPRTFAEDLYTGGDVPASALEHGNPDVFPTEEDLDELIVGESAQPPEIPDPWEGPRTYAEDFYSGGDVLPETLENATPSHLTPREDKLYIPGITSPIEEPSQPTVGKPSHPAVDTGDLVDDDLYADIEGPPIEYGSTNVENAPTNTATDIPGSPPPTHLTRHVDWNWPPAFPGKVATGPGHLDGEQSEIIAISDDEDDEASPGGPSTEAPAALEGGSIDEQTAFVEYTDFGLCDMGPPGSDVQGAFEPVSTTELDFGDLPPSRGDFQDASSVPHDVGEDLLASAVDEGAAEFLEYPDEDEDTAAEDAKKSSEVGGDAPEPSVIVEEVDEDELATAPAAEIDVVSVSGDGVEVYSGKYFVEEVATEGRRTPELEVTPAPEEVPQAGLSSAESTEPIATAEVPSVHIDTELAAASTEDYPAPVSADPTVPDPASIAPTPASPASPASPVDSIASSSGEKEAGAASIPTHAALFPLLRKNAVAHSPSGLFTPLTTGSITPEYPSEEAEAIADGDADGDEEVVVAPQAKPEPEEVAEVELPAVEITEPDDELASHEDVPDNVAQDAAVATPVAPSVEDVVSTNDADVVEAVPRDVSVPPIQDDVPQAEVSEEQRGHSSPNEDQAEEHSPVEVHPDEVHAIETQADEVQGNGAQPNKSHPVEVEREETPSTDADADAEGELDPDYVPSEDEGAESSPAVEEHTLPVLPVEDDDPFFVKSADEPVTQQHGSAQEAQDDDHDSIASSSADKELPVTNGTIEVSAVAAPEVEQAEPAASHEQEVITSQHLAPAVEQEAEPVAIQATEAVASQESEPAASQETEFVASQDTAVDESQDEVRPLKRKRKSPPVEKPTRLLRPRTAKSLDKGKAPDAPILKSKKVKGKGKQRAREESDDEDDARSVASEATSGGSSAAAQQLLIPGSRASSRASSVVSNAPSTYSGLSQPSPTTLRTIFGHGDQPILPLRHDGGILRHHHGARLFAPMAPAPPAAPVIPAPPPLAPQRQASNPPSNASEKSSRASAEPAPSQPAKPPQPVQPLPSRPSVASSASSSSPVTRANCRYHTISIPRSGHARRIHFAVPGCSLGNGELMKEERIQDHGNVDSKDLDKLWPYVEQLNLSSYLLGVLRQLVGVDLLRENEVYYLPKPGDNVKYKRRLRANSTQGETITRAQRESISARTLSHGAFGRAKDVSKDHVPRAIPPPSQASVSTSGGSASHAGKLSERGSAATSASFSESELSDLEDDEEDVRPQKRVKDEHPEPESAPTVEAKAEEPEGEPSQVSVTNGNGTASASTASRRLQPRRSKKLGTDASAYKPVGGESDGSDEEEIDASKKRKRGRGRGIKRKGTEENGDGPPADGASERPKRRRKAAQEASEAAQ